MPDETEDTPLKQLGRMIKAAREARKWTQEELADKAGVSRPTVQRYELGTARLPEAKPLRKITLTLGINILEVPVALGAVTRDEIGLPPEPARQLSPTTEAIVDLLEGNELTNDEKHALLAFLQARRPGPPPPTGKRKAS